MPKVRMIYPENIIDYLEGKGSLKIKLKKIYSLIKDPLMFKRQKEKRQIFEKALSMLPLSPKKIYSDETGELFDYINERYDIVIAGSDAIWNYSVRGFPNPYFLDDSLKCAKLSYAASCYGMNYENIPREQLDRIKSILDTYRFIGVRDAESEKFAEFANCSLKPVHTCDPTVLLDTANLPVDIVKLESHMRQKGYDFDKISIGVMGSDKMCGMVRSLYGNKYQIVSLFNYCKSADVNLYDLNPYEWVYVFRYFTMTFTTYFHGTLLSLRNGTPVICIALENAFTKKHTAKVKDLLLRLSLSDCYFDTDYLGKNYDQIKNQSDKYLLTSYKNDILSKMESERKSYYVFSEAIKSIIKEGYVK